MPITVVGAGIAGLCAAIVLARGGRRVVLHERRGQVGHRFGGDFQGLENWTTAEDVLSMLERLGITTDFEKLPCREGTLFDPRGNSHRTNSESPFFYLIERGPAAHTLDGALLRQAVELGVDVRFNSRVDRLEGPGIIATGPKAADVIAVGYHFSTEMDDGYWAICDDELAPKGYSYLLVWNGRGTVKSCMFSGFKEEKRYVERTVKAFERLVGLEMRDPISHGGFGNFRIPASARSGPHLLVGEHAGFQDALWGFGIRLAIRSGVLAARSLLGGTDYDTSWHSQLRPQIETSLVNRVLFSLLGNRGYGRFIKHVASKPDARAFLRSQYSPSFAKRLLAPWAQNRFHGRRNDASCDHIDCHCIWCRHRKHDARPDQATTQ